MRKVKVGDPLETMLRGYLCKFLFDSPYFFLNDGSGRVSVAKNYISAPDLSITNCVNMNIKWNTEIDPKGSDPAYPNCCI